MRCIPACLLAALATTACSELPILPVPAHLDVGIARIVEGARLDARSAAKREVTLSLELGVRPACNRDQPDLVYGFLIDADKDAQTGATDPAFARLGIDARISAECDPATGRFTSRGGSVALDTDPASGATVLTIRTTVEDLPSVDFYWIAFAHDDPTFVRVPDAPGFAAWAIAERALY